MLTLPRRDHLQKRLVFHAFQCGVGGGELWSQHVMERCGIGENIDGVTKPTGDIGGIGIGVASEFRGWVPGFRQAQQSAGQ